MSGGRSESGWRSGSADGVQRDFLPLSDYAHQLSAPRHRIGQRPILFQFLRVKWVTKWVTLTSLKTLSCQMRC